MSVPPRSLCRDGRRGGLFSQTERRHKKQEGNIKKKGRCNETERQSKDTKLPCGLKVLDPHTQGIEETAHKY